MNRNVSAGRRSLPRVAGVCLAAAAVAVLPSFGAFAADEPLPPTIRAAIGEDGGVLTATEFMQDGGSSDFAGEMPISVEIGHTSSGSQQTYTYHVENTFEKTETVHYEDTLGNARHTSIILQLPLVAQLGVNVPKSAGEITAPGATVTSDSGGVRHVLWNMVLFTPLGSPSQDVSFTTASSGDPMAELRATAVDPTTSPGISGVSQAASAAYQQADFWASYAHGGNTGLIQLSDGTAQMVDGLVQLYAGSTQLHSGIGEAVDGAKLLDDGTAQAYDGSKELSNGLGKIHGGLGQLAAKDGLPAAVDGVQQLKKGVDKVLAGIGDDATPNTLVNGASQLANGLSAIVTAFGSADDAAHPGIAFGIRCAQDVVDLVVNGNAAPKQDPCFASLGGTKPPLPALSTVAGTAIYNTLLTGVLAQALTPINAAMTAQIVPGLNALADGAKQIRAGLSTGSNKNPGVKEGLDQISAGLSKLKKGLVAAVDGVQKLDAGSGKAYAGSKDLSSGLGQLSAGQHQVVEGLPAALDGTAQLSDGVGQVLDGAKQVNAGINQVHSDAIAPLEKQLKQASQNGHKQLAVLTAAGALASSGPGGAGASYVLSQGSGDDVELSAARTSSSLAGSGNAARNVGIGLGAFALLVLAVGGGFALGRRQNG